MLKFLLWCILFVLCWPVAVWDCSLSSGLVAADSVPARRHHCRSRVALFKAIITLPARILGQRPGK